MPYYEPTRTPGRHFLQIPGPTNTPDRILRAMDNPTMDHRGPDFGHLGAQILANLKKVFQTDSHVIIYPASGTGAWEAALANTHSPDDTVLMCRTGWFATLWNDLAERLSLKPIFIDTDWRRGADVDAIQEALSKDTAHTIRSVCVVHNETSTGCTSRIDEIRAAIDATRHPALLLVDTISSLASIDYRHDEWGVDVTIAGSQKGLMLPPGLAFNAISAKALEATKSAKLPRSYWDWHAMLAANATGYFPFTPATNLLYGLDTALTMLLEEGLPNVFARHTRHAEATRRAVAAWGLETQCADPRHFSAALTAVRLPEHHSADHLRATILARYNMSLGNGLGPLKDQVFRIGHLGDLNDLQLLGTIAGIEMGLANTNIPHHKGGTQAAMDYLSVNSN